MIGILKHASRWIAIGVCAPCALAGVLTVGGAGAMYPDLPEAVAAAVDGDVLLVRPGYYSGFTIDAKAIAIVADAGAVVTIGEPSAVRNLAAGQTVLLSGLSLPLPFGASALTLANNAGRVRVEKLDAHAANYVFSHSWYAVDIANCADASFVDCDLFGRPGEYGGLGYGHGGEAALHAVSSSVALYDCNLSGGLGLHGFLNPPSGPTAGAPGAAAFEGFDTTLIARGSSFTGGNGGAGFNGGAPPPFCSDPYNYPTAGGSGGPGVYITGALSVGRLIASTAVGGDGGIGGTDPCGNQMAQGPSGPPLSDPGGVITVLAGPALALSVPEPAREGQPLALHFSGPPGYRAILAIGAGGAGWFWVPSLQGVLLVQPPLRRLSLGVIPASGVLDVQLPVPDLGAGVDASLVHAQAVFVDAGGQSLLASPGVLVLLDASF